VLVRVCLLWMQESWYSNGDDCGRKQRHEKNGMTRCGGWSIDGGEILLPLQPGLCSRAAHISSWVEGQGPILHGLCTCSLQLTAVTTTNSLE
jgi:hypothetical protein